MRSVGSKVRVCSSPINMLAGGPPFPNRVFTLGGCTNMSEGRPRDAFTKILRLSPCDEKVNKVKVPKSLSDRSEFMGITFAGLGTVSKSKRGRDIDRFFRVLNSISRRQKYYRMSRNTCRVAVCASYYGAAGKVCCCAACSGRRVATMSVCTRGLSSSGLVHCPVVLGNRVQ